MHLDRKCRSVNR